MPHKYIKFETELSEIAESINIFLLPKTNEAPELTGVYFLFNQLGMVVYIGKSKNIKKRIADHLRLKIITFSSLAFIEYPENRIHFYERAFLNYHLPLYNNDQPTQGKKYMSLFSWHEDIINLGGYERELALKKLASYPAYPNNYQIKITL